MKKFFIPLLLSICLLCLTSCTVNNGQNQSIDASSNNASVMEKHVVSITMENYLKFIEFSTSGGHGQISYHFTGCLSYAFYDISFTLSYKTSSNDDIASTETEIVTCNAAGNGTFVGGGKYGAEIISATGSVIYWI